MRRASLWPLALALFGCAPSAPPVDQTAARVERILGRLQPSIVVVGRPRNHFPIADRMAHHHTPAVSIAIADSGRIVWAGAIGLKQAGGADTVTTGTLFQAASISKPVSATAMLRLVEEGKLDLDSDVNRHLKSWQLPGNRFTEQEQVTLRRIATHAAGLTVHGFPGYAEGDPLPTVPQILDGAKPANTGPVRVDTTPGSIWRYSGGGTTVMQLAMTDVTGRAFPVLLKELVLDPAGMSTSTYEQPLPAARAPEAAAGHKPDGSVVPGRWHTYPEMAAAGLWTTPTDLLRWAFAIAASRRGEPNGLLRKETVDEMLTVQKAPTGIGPFLDGSGAAFNFGHGGSNEGFRSQLTYYPETGQGAALMANSDNGTALIQELLFAIAEEYGWPGYAPREITPLALDSARLAAVVGEYRVASPPITVLISAEAGRGYLEAPGVVAREEFVFVDSTRVVGVDSGNEFEFELPAGGPAAALRVANLRFTRVRK